MSSLIVPEMIRMFPEKMKQEISYNEKKELINKYIGQIKLVHEWCLIFGIETPFMLESSYSMNCKVILCYKEIFGCHILIDPIFPKRYPEYFSFKI